MSPAVLTRAGLDVPRPEGWTKDAACSGLVSAEADPWHPEPESRHRLTPIARQICAGCPVREQCLEYGLRLLAVGEVRGMYGGLTEKELRELARSQGRPTRRVARHGTRTRYVNYKCRCPLCVKANARAEHARRIRKSAKTATRARIPALSGIIGNQFRKPIPRVAIALYTESEM